MENSLPGAVTGTSVARPLQALLARLGFARMAVATAPVVPEPATAVAVPAGPLAEGDDDQQPVDRLRVYAIGIFYLAAVALGEYLTAAVEPQLGIPFHSAIMVLILFHGAVTRNVELRNFIWVLAMSPLIRVMSLTLPLYDLPFIWWYFVISIPLFAAAIMLIRTIGYTRHDVFLDFTNLKWQPLILLAGPPLGFAEYLILRPQPLMSAPDFNHFYVPALILLVSTGLSEELIFRGIMQRAAEPLMSRWPAAIFVNLVFAVLHSGYLSFLDLVFVFFAGFLFSWFSIRTRSLLGVTLTHGLVNQFLFLIMPYTGILPPLPPR